LNTQTPTLELSSVFFAYPRPEDGLREEILQGVDLRVMPGEALAVMGPSGCGKSTLLQIMASLLAPQKGSVLFQGKDLVALSENEQCRFRNRDLGFVFQSHRLLAQCSALENVLLPTIPNNDPSQYGTEEERARSLLDRVGLGDRIHHRPFELSMGQRQRVAVARALMNTPGLLLADEPTGALDHHSSDQLMDLLSELRRELNLSMVLVTHAPQVAKAMDRVLELRDGRMGEG
jgi:ABC-type lipoprotein export system ATPase subunit